MLYIGQMAKSKKSQFQQFAQWASDRGLTKETTDLYLRNIRLCLSDPRGIVARVSQGDLAPKTRRTNKAALCAWADFQGDTDFRARLRDIRLPPPDRVKEKRALELDEWRRVCAALDEADIDDNLRAAIGMVCKRGFRVGDVMRLDRRTVQDGLRTGVIKYLAKGRRRIPWTVTDQFRPYLELFMEQRRWETVADLVAPRWTKNRHHGAVLSAQRAFPVVLEAAGIDPEGVSLHIMRRTYAWHYLRTCNDPVKLQKHMQWKSIATAMQYVDQAQREELDAIADEMSAMLA